MNTTTPVQFSPRRARFGRCWVVAALLLLPGTRPASAQSGNSTNIYDFSAFKIISERNIFDPNRRPRIASGPAPKIVDSFSLAGTMVYGESYYSIFDGTSSDYRKVLQPGGAIAGHTVTHIGLDCVKLSSGTNLLEVKVGTQVRRNEDGQWSVGESADSPLASYAGGSSRSRTSRRRSTAAPQPGDSRVEPAPAAAPGSIEAAPSGESSESELTTPPPESAGADSNDPIARMMRRRAEELNGNENRTPNQ